MTVTRLLRVSLTVADLARAEAFYSGAFGFTRVAPPADVDPAWLTAMGVPDAAARGVTLRLRAQQLELMAFDPPGQPYPPARAANDLWFQHVAIVTSDMDFAWQRVTQAGITPITEGGPQRLPPNTGSVRAVKFRDPDGHPLELLRFPPGTGDPAWQHGTKDALFLGYDHSAIVVRDITASLRFYNAMLGLQELSRSVNHGPEQQRLDHLPAVTVDVIALRPQAATTPHLELLGYRTPSIPAANPVASIRDIAATRLVLEMDDLPAIVVKLRQAGWVCPDSAALPDGSRASLVSDPNGHRLILLQPPPSS